jgi:myo-inositol-1-phosphate synthase
MAGKKVRTAIIGVGNCASSLVQGVQFYKNAKNDDVIPGIMHTQLGEYHISDIEFTLALTSTPPRSAKTYRKLFSPSRTTPINLQMSPNSTCPLCAA